MDNLLISIKFNSLGVFYYNHGLKFSKKNRNN